MNHFILFFIALAFAEIQTCDCGETAETITCSYDTQSTTLTISGSGSLSPDKPWMSNYASTTKIIITATIDSIPEYAFSAKNWW